MAMTIRITEEPILPRLDRLDNMLRQLEEIRGCNRSSSSPKSSYASTPSSGTLTSTDGHLSSLDFSPKSIEKHCRPIDHVIMETGVKGTLIERLDHVEDRVLKMEEELEAEKKREETEKKERNKKGLKQLVKQCLKGKRKHKTTE
ncbi:uncharacterized protein LOC107417610 isoform X2 [Ziziphus jujuba]|uniref:Uncharacterized protein LOC107417610 isoform X2 n=1 Tax=Ziziphus jujuba TaxID=326968 RepID=A0ABM3IKI7_ZIZJJ|nr:uncharacterized protein LOC107417610 isoform X2 [Ziziphus jujuba]